MLPEAVSSVLRHKGSDRKVLSISPDASVYEAIALIADNSIGALLVVADGVLVGIMSERDYARKVVLQSRSSKDTRVADIMTPRVYTVKEDATVSEIASLMLKGHLHRLLVTREDRAVGIITTSDLLGLLVGED